MTKQDEEKVRVIVREETGDLRQDVAILKVDMKDVKTGLRHALVLLENLDHRILAIAENVSTAGKNSMRMNNLDERLTVVEHLHGINT